MKEEWRLTFEQARWVGIWIDELISGDWVLPPNVHNRIIRDLEVIWSKGYYNKWERDILNEVRLEYIQDYM